MTKLKQKEFYCVKCRRRVTCNTEDICVKIYKNKNMVGKKVPTLFSECPYCETNLNKFIKHDLTEKMIEKYGLC